MGRMTTYLWISVAALTAATATAVLRRPPVLAPERERRHRQVLSHVMTGGLSLGLLLLLTAGLRLTALANVASPAAAAAGIGEASWILLVWLGPARPDEGGGSDPGHGPDDDPVPDGPLVRWDDFDRARAGWRERVPS